MVEIRVTGTIYDCQYIIEQMYDSMHVISVSKPYPNRGSDDVRIYVKVK